VLCLFVVDLPIDCYPLFPVGVVVVITDDIVVAVTVVSHYRYWLIIVAVRWCFIVRVTCCT